MKNLEIIGPPDAVAAVAARIQSETRQQVGTAFMTPCGAVCDLHIGGEIVARFYGTTLEAARAAAAEIKALRECAAALRLAVAATESAHSYAVERNTSRRASYSEQMFRANDAARAALAKLEGRAK